MDKRALFSGCAAGFAFSANYTNHAPMVSALRGEFGFDQVSAGLLTTGIFLSHGLMMLPGGRLADKFGPVRVMTIALAWIAVSNFAIAFAGAYWQLLLWKLIAGIGTGACFTAGARYVVNVFEGPDLHVAQGMFGGSVMLGSGFVVFAVPQLLGTFGWRGAFLGCALLAAAVWLWWMVGAPRLTHAVKAAGSFWEMMGRRELWLLGLIQMASFGLMIVVGTWITTLLKTSFHIPLKTAGLMGSMVLLLGIFSRPLGGWLAHRVPVRTLVGGALTLNAIACAALAWGQWIGLTMAAIVVLGAGCGLPYAGVFNRAAALFPGRAGAAMGLVNMVGILMILLGAPAVGYLADWTGQFRTSFGVLAGFATVSRSIVGGPSGTKMNLTHLFDLSLIGRREEVALEFAGRTYTFGEIDQRSNGMAALFRARGLEAGDRLCVYLANCLELIDIYLACVKLGVIFVPINILYRDREITHILSDAEPKAVVAAQDMPGVVPVWRVDELNSPENAARPEVALDGDAPAALVYTSGTTGVSKGAILTHNNFASNAINLNACWEISSDDRFLLALPLFHVHALGNGLHCWLMSGCRMRLLERFEHQKAPGEFLDFQPTLFFGVPTVYVRMLDFSLEVAHVVGRSMRLFVSGSAPLSEQVFEEFRARFGHAILERYGMTETLMNLSNPYVGERRAGTVGLPLPGVSARIVEGEVQLRGPNIFAGYWRREDATRAAFVDGWFRTGDMAECSADGYYTLLGRKSDLIISGGFNIYPREIEDFLMEHDAVAEAAVVGVADKLRGEIPVAYIVAKGVCDVSELEARCRAGLASFKVPREFVMVEKLPRTALGKIQKHLLPAR